MHNAICKWSTHCITAATFQYVQYAYTYLLSWMVRSGMRYTVGQIAPSPFASLTTRFDAVFAVFPLTFVGSYQNAYEEKITDECNPSPSAQCCGNTTYQLAHNGTIDHAFNANVTSISPVLTTTLLVADTPVLQFQKTIDVSSNLTEVAPYVLMSTNITVPRVDNNTFPDALWFRPGEIHTSQGSALKLCVDV